MIRVKGNRPATKEDFVFQAQVWPAVVEVETVRGAGDYFKGMLNDIPPGRYYVKDGKIAALLTVEAVGKVKVQ